MNNTVSQSKDQENGIPQGSIPSVTLFIIKIDEITRLIPRDSRFHSSLSIDDLQIAYRHTDLHIIQKNLQVVLNKILEWTCKNGFKFSQTKTAMIHFKNTDRLVLTLNLCLDQQQIKIVPEVKIFRSSLRSNINL